MNRNNNTKKINWKWISLWFKNQISINALLKFKNNIQLIRKYISQDNLILKIDVFYFDQFLHNLSNQFFKNLILIRFKELKLITCMFIKI
jgi:hypothetical protein